VVLILLLLVLVVLLVLLLVAVVATRHRSSAQLARPLQPGPSLPRPGGSSC
jgi:hypothetical protein